MQRYAKRKRCLDVVNAFHEFIEGSAKRHALFEHLQENSLTLKHLADTRWTTRSTSLHGKKETLPSIMEFIEVISIVFQ